MEKVKDFFKNHSTEIISILVAISAFVSSFIQLGGRAGAVCSIIVGVIAVVVATIKIITYYFSSGLDDHLVKMAVALIEMIINLINGNAVTDTTVSTDKTKDNTKVSGMESRAIHMTREEIESEFRERMALKK